MPNDGTATSTATTTATGATASGTTGGNAGTTSTGGSAATGGGNAPWFSGFENQELRGYTEQKGFKSAEEVVKSYRDLHAIHGVPAERIIKLPEDLNAPKALDDVYKRLGRPEKSDGYEIQIPDGAQPDFANWAKETFHGLGLSKAQGENLSKVWNERIGQMNAKFVEDQKVAVAQQIETLKTKWGAAFEQNTAKVNALAEKLGVKTEEMDAMAAAVGVDRLNEMLHGFMEKLGVKIGEDDIKGVGSAGSGFNTILSPEAAQSKINELTGDVEWRDSYLKGDVKKAAQMRQLQLWASGGQ